MTNAGKKGAPGSDRFFVIARAGWNVDSRNHHTAVGETTTTTSLSKSRFPEPWGLGKRTCFVAVGGGGGSNSSVVFESY